jgi:hypothetical protein
LDLSTYKWRNRLLLIFAPSASDEDHKEQIRLLEGSETGSEDRDLILATIFEDGAGELEDGAISMEEASGLRETFGIPKDRFTVVLVGKDGGEKFRSYIPVSLRDIFDRIDAMPMRRREMHKYVRSEEER